jgi:DNA-binding transcriptional ArsR family regulator
MSMEPNVAAAASLIADPTRAAMLAAMLEGRALPAGELAYAAGVTAQTASAHLSKLLAGGLIDVETQGRHRYYRLAGSHVADAIEQLATIRPAQPVRRMALSAEAKRLRYARCCYDHLAGQLGVAVTCALQERGFIVPTGEKRFDVTPAGAAWFGGIGLDLAGLKPTPRGLARQCLDWTERTHHLAGPLGVQLLRVLCKNGWLRRSSGSRAVALTPKGRTELKRHLGVEPHRWESAGPPFADARYAA